MLRERRAEGVFVLQRSENISRALRSNGPKLGSKLHLAWVSAGILRTGNVHLDFHLDVGSVFPDTARYVFGKHARFPSRRSPISIWKWTRALKCPTSPETVGFNRPSHTSTASLIRIRHSQGPLFPAVPRKPFAAHKGNCPGPNGQVFPSCIGRRNSDPEPTSGPSRPWTGKFFSVSFGIRAKNGISMFQSGSVPNSSIPSKGLNDPTPHRRQKNLGLRFQV